MWRNVPIHNWLGENIRGKETYRFENVDPKIKTKQISLNIWAYVWQVHLKYVYSFSFEPARQQGNHKWADKFRVPNVGNERTDFSSSHQFSSTFAT